MTDLGTFGRASSSAFNDIDNPGQIVRTVDDRTGGASRGFLSDGDARWSRSDQTGASPMT